MTVSPRSITWIRRLLLGTAVLVTLAAACLVEEDWRGNRDWRRTEARYAARGESLRLAAFTGPAVPDRENLFHAPVWANLTSDHTPKPIFAQAWTASGLRKLETVKEVGARLPNMKDAREQMIRAGLIPANDAQPLPQAILAGLDSVRPLCDGLRTAARDRPLGGAETVGPFQMSDLRIGEIFRVAQVLCFRAYAELAAGQPAEAHADMVTALRIARAVEIKPATLLQAMVALAITDCTKDTIQVAFAAHCWSEPQVVELQRALADLETDSYMVAAFRAERAWYVAAIDSYPNLSHQQRRRFGLPRWMPSGWLQENKVAVCDLVHRQIDVLDALGTPEFTLRLEQLQHDSANEARRGWPMKYVTISYPALTGIIRSYGLEIDAINGVVLATALERYYLTAGHYPDTLAALVPTYLRAIPRLSTGEAFGYQPTANRAGFELHETPDKDDTPRSWIQPRPPEAATGAPAHAMTELERRRELGRAGAGQVASRHQ